jgi:hypothetical protein
VALGEADFSQSRRMITVAVSAEAVWQIVSKALSSPQTAELNAHSRAPTIGKWVNIASVEAAAWVGFFCVLDGSLWPLVGGALAGVTTWYQYKYAITSGLQSGAPATESH